MVQRALKERASFGGVLVDVGCGTGNLRSYVGSSFARYIGVDAVKYEAFPGDAEFIRLDLDSGRAPLPDGIANVVVAVETIEHLENPRAFVRELTRLAAPGGWVVITTPNQCSLLSLANVVLRGQFVAFKDENYPAHLTALLPSDLRRIAQECCLCEEVISYSHAGRVLLTRRHYPAAVSRAFPQAFSDNVLIIGRKPHV